MKQFKPQGAEVELDGVGNRGLLRMLLEKKRVCFL